jgi:hypothetical protein
MKNSDLFIFLTSLLNEIKIDATLFATFLDVAQMRVEDIRPWVVLRSEDKTQTVPAGTTYTTPFNFPAANDWKEFYSADPVSDSQMFLLDSNNNQMGLKEVPFSSRFQFQNTFGKFCVDYVNSKIYLLGIKSYGQSFTLQIPYIKTATLISSAPTATWALPTRYSKILSLQIAEMWKNGIDYDVFSDAQATKQGQQAMAILDLMTRWDSRLQLNMTKGLDPFGNEIGANNTLNGSNLI